MVRGQGNHAGRSRLTAAAELRAGKPPRGLILLTGEDLPGGSSLRARVWTVEVAASTVTFARLSECQRDAAAGLYAEALAGFTRWLAADLLSRRDQHRDTVARQGGELAGTGGRSRVPTSAADLFSTLDLILTFASTVGAIAPDEVDQLRARGRAAIVATATAQADHQSDSDPASRFVALLPSVLSSNRAHLAARDGTRPDEATAAAAGWRLEHSGWVAQGRRIGWLVGDKLYLDPEAALAEVVKLAAEQGQPLPVTGRTLWKQLYESGHLAETKGGDGQPLRYRVPRTVEGRNLHVIALYADRLFVRVSPAGEGGRG